MKTLPFIVYVFLLMFNTINNHALADTSSAQNSLINSLQNHEWYSGSKNCKTDNQPAIEIYQYNPNTYILRQNKCTHYEAPFIYLLIGNTKALVVDTGATEDAANFPLASTVMNIVSQHKNTHTKDYDIIVAHSHSHSDHIAGDKQFLALENIQLITPKKLDAVTHAFGLDNWPNKNATIDLGNRLISIIPSPGHQQEAISFYDHNTQWLLTGDTLYPGRLYVKHWNIYKESIARLSKFSKNLPVSAVLGAHIEMSNQAGKDYKMGSTYHPKESSLVLSKHDLFKLDQKLHTLGNTPQKHVMDKFIIYPIK
jgi:glyoxylase-like metal-dependent hydrolase (beta-lactamase superfamily II)